MSQRSRLHRRLLVLLLLGLLVPTVPPSAAEAQQRGEWWQSLWQMPQVWQLTDGAGVTVGLVDTGVDASVSELAGAVVPGTNLAGPGDGLEDIHPSGHGTAMATTIAARGGDSGLVGIAPGATILPIATENSHTGALIDQFATGIRYAVDNGAGVVNISQAASYGSGLCPAPVAEAVRYAVSRDVVVVAGSGNRRDGTTPYPGACPGVVTVGAVDEALVPWDRSHRSEYVDVAAPGVDTAAVVSGGTVSYGDGTSVSSALVSGVVALIRSQFPDASADEVVRRLLATVQDVTPAGRNDATGYGLVRPYEALTASVPANAPNPVFDPLGDLSDVPAPPDGAPDGFPTPPARDDLEFNPISAADGSAYTQAMISSLLIAGGVLLGLAAAVVIVVLLVLRGRRRRRRARRAPASA